jgi:SNF2 family DNA or RNA helicase
MIPSESSIRRYSSRRQRLDRSFLAERLHGALAYDRIAGYFTSSLLEIAGEEIESVRGTIRVVCNSSLNLRDVQTAQAARDNLRLAWTSARPESVLDLPGGERLQKRYEKLYVLLKDGKLQVRVLPDKAFGLIHGKAGVITLADGTKTSFLGSVNETAEGWQLNYELLWEDPSAEAVNWVQEEFDALWNSPYAVPLADAIVEDIQRLAHRRVIYEIPEWRREAREKPPEPAPAVIELPIYRQDKGLWEHQKFFIRLAYEAHHGPYQQARYILADQVGLGKTLQLATTALLIALTGSNPILILAPKTLLWQWQAEMRDLLDMPSAVWNGRQWVDENGLIYPANGAEDILKCPRRVGIVSTGLVTRISNVAEYLLDMYYDCVILDEAHRARRRNLKNPEEPPDMNNLLDFMHKIARRTRSLLMATATPIQLHPVEVWDLLDVLAEGNDFVLGNKYSRWRHPQVALALITGRQSLPHDLAEKWEWIRNPLPPAKENKTFELLRRNLDLPDDQAVVPGDRLSNLRPSDCQRIQRRFDELIQFHNPLIRHVIRRTREQLENSYDPETKEPYLPKIKVRLFGEKKEDAIPLTGYLRQAYELAEDFCTVYRELHGGGGFLETLLLRRIGSSIYAGQRTVERILGITAAGEEEEEEEEEETTEVSCSRLGEKIGKPERDILNQLWQTLLTNRERDPKYEKVRHYLFNEGWLEERGCIIFSQYRDSIEWFANQLREEIPDEPIAVYSGAQSSGMYYQLSWHPLSRETLKKLVLQGQIRLMLGTDAASEGLNLQKIGSLINLDLPWNPTRLEQRKGRIQRIGQRFEEIYICNLRYQDSVEDRVHDLLSERLEAIYNVFGQLPDFLEDVWVAVAYGEQERAKQIIDAVPQQHPFEIRYTNVEKVNWETCAEVLYEKARRDVLQRGWREK